MACINFASKHQKHNFHSSLSSASILRQFTFHFTIFGHSVWNVNALPLGCHAYVGHAYVVSAIVLGKWLPDFLADDVRLLI